MSVIELHISIKKAFGNLHRKQCVLVAVQNDSGNILVGAKSNFYPPSITRLLGGGVYDGESTEVAAVREMHEELNITLQPSDLTHLITFDTYATDQTGQAFHNQTHVYHVKVVGQTYKAGDDITAIVELTVDDLYELGERYAALPDTLWYKDSKNEFCWADYSKMYAPIHKMTADKIRSL